MDKFDRRPTAKQKRAKLLWFVLAASIPASWFFTMFAFGNKALPWFFASYGALLAALLVFRGRAILSNSRLWEKGLNHQPEPWAGFTPMELAVIEAADQAAPDARLRAALAGAEVALRYDSGHGAVSTIKGGRPLKSPAVFDASLWFKVSGLDAPVGARLWPDAGGAPELIELFTEARTGRLDWTRAAFEVIDTPRAAPVPKTRPIVTEPQWKTFRDEG